MRLAVFILVALGALACSREPGPIAPSVPNAPAAPPDPIPPAGENPPSGSTFLLGVIVDRSGACIAGATIRVVAGQRAGESMVQSTPCGVWDYSGGFEFEHLTPGVAMTLRASAAGYADLEQTLTPSSGVQTAYIFALSLPGHD